MLQHSLVAKRCTELPSLAKLDSAKEKKKKRNLDTTDFWKCVIIRYKRLIHHLDIFFWEPNSSCAKICLVGKNALSKS